MVALSGPPHPGTPAPAALPARRASRLNLCLSWRSQNDGSSSRSGVVAPCSTRCYHLVQWIVCRVRAWVRETLGMVMASGGLEWKRGGRVTDGRESILRVHARDVPCESTASLCLSGYRDAPMVMISQPGPPHRTRPPRSAPLSLSRDRARSSRPMSQSDWSVLGYTPPPALGNTGRQSRVPERSHCGETSLSLVRSDPSRLSGTTDSGKGCSHHFTVSPEPLWRSK